MLALGLVRQADVTNRSRLVAMQVAIRNDAIVVIGEVTMYALMTAASQVLLTCDDLEDSYILAKSSSQRELFPIVVHNMETGAEAIFHSGMLISLYRPGDILPETIHTHGTPSQPSTCHTLNCGGN